MKKNSKNKDMEQNEILGTQNVFLENKSFSYTADVGNRDVGFEKHNRTVLFLKLFMPSFAVVAIALMILWPEISEQKDKFRIGVTRPLLVSQTENLSIVNSQFFSSDNKNQPFMLGADLAIETEPNSRIINMTKPKASILLNSGTRVNVDADSGILYQLQNKVTLSGNCVGVSDAGHRLETENVLIDINDNSLTGREKTFFYFPEGKIESDGLEIRNKGDIIKFTGNARMTITLKGKKTAANSADDKAR